MKKILVLLFFFLVITSCTSNQSISSGLNYTEDLFENAQDADSVFRQIVKENRIIFIGGDAHIYSDCSDFLDKHMQMLYDEGVRYIFFEGGEPPEGYNAALCAQKLDKNNLSKEYLYEKATLNSERKIDVSIISLTWD